MIRAGTGLSAVLCATFSAACGVRGDPLPPRLIVPAPVADLSAERFGDQVYVQFGIPEANNDGTQPADLERVDLYALTAAASDALGDVTFDDWLDAATLVARLGVARPAGDDASDPGAGAEAAAGGGLPAQGDRVTVIEELTPTAMEPVAIGDDGPREMNGYGEGRPAGPLVGPPLPRPPARIYVALAVSGRGRESRPSQQQAVPLGPAPEPPASPRVTYDEDRIALAWSPPATAGRPVQRAAADAELPSRALLPLRTATRYEVYDAAASPDAAAARAPRPLHAAPLAGTSYREANPVFGVERCFVVRTVDEIDGTDVRSAPSEAACRELVDRFAPAAPTGLAAVAAAGVVNLVWTPNAEDDVAGYVVLRARGAGATLGALTAEPVAATTYRDATAEAGVSYEYAVQAVDDALPPNVSPPSERVREQAR